ncbi:possible tyrosine transporter P-protein (TC 2.A.45.2.1) [Gracilibacillus ureilyticus]|uniref:Possible tyrosine transporter P-protein (TC 2.A.45.2.1) n=1 Tax=Gracilibacillus ureilyticus TaxID=531814 RepID=A0A1H9RN80_9BACI|nr:ArsB/NhaD family transporter [Gracilibacillus ureilyticus]SER73935.1 possible tyrosine transporter P-protein (TC 2.A.45.2.1) [Gracilibacillus ureilyticus]
MAVTIAIAIFIISYIFIMTEKINRALVALAGGLLLLLTDIYEWEAAVNDYIDWNTVALLFAMMVLVSITKKTGVFSYIAILLAKIVKGRPVPLLVGIAVLTAVGSALLDNVTTVLLFVPVILTLTNLLKLPAFPYLITIIISANIGGTATLIGDPPNIMIGQAVPHLTFVSFLQHTAPVAIMIFILAIFILILLFRKKLNTIDQENIKQLMKLKEGTYLNKTPLLFQSLSVLCLTITGFILHPVLHIDLTIIALTGAIMLLLISEKEVDTEKVFEQVEWVTLFFFIGLFMLVGGLEEVGVIDELARSIMWMTEGDMMYTGLLLLWTSGLFSGIIDNIPFVAAMIPVIQEFESYGMANLDPLWWSLALGACLGGNATLIGASANVVVAGLAEAQGERIPFVKYMIYGLPIVLLSLIIATIYLYFRYLLPYQQTL